MVEHLVWFKLKEGVSDEDKSAMLQALRALKTQVPNILHLACGEDFSGRSKGFQIGLVVRFPNRPGAGRIWPASRSRGVWPKLPALVGRSYRARF